MTWFDIYLMQWRSYILTVAKSFWGSLYVMFHMLFLIDWSTFISTHNSELSFKWNCLLDYMIWPKQTGLNQLQWGKKVFIQPPIVQVLPLKKMREACNFHHRYTSTMRDKLRKKNPENHIVGFLRIYLQIMVENKYLVTYKQARLLALTDL